MEIWHFFVIFYDFVMKCVYKSTIYTLLYKSVHVNFVFWVTQKHPTTPYISGTFVLAPPPPPRRIVVDNECLIPCNTFYLLLGLFQLN